MPQFSLSPNISVREEDFGGLAFVRTTGVILRLSKGAYCELEQVRNNGGFCDIAKDDEKRLQFYRILERFGMVQEVSVYVG